MATRQTHFILFLLALLITCSNTWVVAQEVAYIQIDVEDGLPSHHVYRVLQDRQGFVWMATDAGVVRFDGQHFQLFTAKDGLTNNDVLNMQEDSQGRLWMMTLAGGFCYYQEGKIYNPTTDPWLRNGPKTSYQASFFEDSQQNLWFITRQEGIFCLREDTTLNFPVPGELARYGVGALWEDKEGNILVRTFDEIWQLYPKPEVLQSKLEPFSHIAAGLPVEDGVLTCDYEGGLWFSGRKQHDQVGQLQSGERAIFIRELADKCTWVSTLDGGVERLKRSGSGDELVSVGYFFPDEIITSVIQDREGNTWFSTEKAGVYLLRPHKIMNYPALKGLEGDGVRSMIRSSDDQLWLCSEKGLLARGSSLSDRFVTSNFRPGSEFNGVIGLTGGGVMGYGSGAMLIPGGDPSVVFYDPPKNNGKVGTTFSGKDGSVLLTEIGSVKSMVADQKVTYWGVSNHYLFQYDPTKRPENSITTLEEGRFASLAEGENGTIWVGRSDGLYAYQNGKLQSHQHAHPSFAGAATDLACSKQFGLWVATNGQGLINYDPHTGETWQITSEDGLASNLCQDLNLIDDRYLWVSTKSGLSRIDLNSDFRNAPAAAIRTLTRSEGLLSNEVSATFIEGDTVMACTPKGISVFHFQEASRKLPPPPLFINHVHVADSHYSPDTKLSLPHQKNSPTFTFTALSYGSLGKVKYEYRLHPLETDWNVTTLQEATYNQLPPGSYTFGIRAIAKDGTPSRGITEFAFNIRNAWWQTWLFRIATAIFLALLIWGAVVLRYRNRNRRIELEMKFLESERKALRAQMNPHFIFNSLNSIQNFLAKNDRKAAYTYLARFGKLIRSILENSDKTYITIEEELTVLNLYLQIESLRTDHQFTFEIQVDPEIHPGSVLIPPMLLQPYVENAIWHGVMPRKSGGHIAIGLNSAEDGLFCRIEDNGVGRAASAKSGRQDQAKRSFGTRITEERLTLLNAQQGKKLTVSTCDLTDAEGNALGTRVELFVPFIRIKSNP